VAQLEVLVRAGGSTLGELCGLDTRSVDELLVETGDPRRFTEGGFARFKGSAPLPASTAEAPGEPRAQAIYANARANGHTKKEARRVLKRHLSDVVHRRMIRDLAQASPPAQPSSLPDPARAPRGQRWPVRAERQ
jgi:transposase